ncbi:MAG: DUF3775 domain-containing protein [Pseudomonadota bacterium]
MDVELSREMLAQMVLMGREMHRGEAELRAMIDALPEDDQARLVAIMWIGRGAFEPEEWAEAVQTAAQEASTPCADYVLGTPHFTDHIEAGMSALGSQIFDEESGLVRFA